MSLLLADIRVAARRLTKRPGFTAIAVASLAIGIGANTAAFSLIDAILLRRAPIPARDRVAEIYQHQAAFAYSPFSIPDLVDFRAATVGVFSRVSASQFAVAPRDLGNSVESLPGELVNGDYFPLLGVQPAAGRLLGPEDDVAPGAHPVVVLSYDYWQRSFAGDPATVGRSIRLGGRDYTVVGIAPKTYAGMIPGLVPSFYASVQMLNQLQPDIRDQLKLRGNHSSFIKARLAPGVSMEQAKTVAATFTADIARRYPREWTPGTYLVVIPSTSIMVNPILDGVVVPAAATLLVVVGIVLVVACSNLASFLLAQARDRQREVAVRLAIGATRGALIRQMLVEAFALALLGGAAGVALAQLALRVLLAGNLPVPIPVTLDVSLDGRVLLFSIAATAAAALLFGLLPALQATRLSVMDTIKNENVGGGAPRRITMRNALVVGQVAASLLLLVIGSLFLRSLQAFANVDPGFG